MILLAIGANLPSPRFGNPKNTCEAALDALEKRDIRIIRRSRWHRTSPVPPSDQPDYINGVVAVETTLPPSALLAAMHAVEEDLGRTRSVRNAARIIDLDLIAYDDVVSDGAEGPQLPHPRMDRRAFVLLPLADVAPGWRHPGTGRTVEELIAELPPDQTATPIC